MNPQDATEYDGPMSEEEDMLTALRIMGYDYKEAEQVIANHLGERDDDETIALAYDEAFERAAALVREW